MSSASKGARLLGALAVGSVALAGCHGNTPGPRAASAGISPLRFTEVAATSGLVYRFSITGPRPLNILQEIGNGCAFLDFNGDGNLDALLVGDHPGLFRGDGKGKFVDVTAASGLATLQGPFSGCAVGDYDGDGRPDIYLSGYRNGSLLHNEGGGKFRDESVAAGLAKQPWATSCAFADVNGDGRLDLIIANYARFGKEPGIPQLCDSHGQKTACGPRYYKPLRPTLYLNQDRKRFKDVSAAAGFLKAGGRGLGIALAPLDDTGLPYIAFANDELPGDLMQPAVSGGGVHYTNISGTAGTNTDRDGHELGGMGTDWGDYDNDGKPDLLVATYQGEAKTLFHNKGSRLFVDASYEANLNPSLFSRVSFGCKFADWDNDGWQDLMIANGHIQDNIQKIDPSTTYRQTTVLMRNGGGPNPRFEDVSAKSGEFFRRPLVGRGLAVGDYDNDGKLDALVVDSEGSAALLHNESRTGHWLRLRLKGKGPNPDALGATVTAKFADGTSQLRLCQTAGSYLSASDSRIHFGLGSRAQVEELSVRWPSGASTVYRNLAADRDVMLVEGNPQVQPVVRR